MAELFGAFMLGGHNSGTVMYSSTPFLIVRVPVSQDRIGVSDPDTVIEADVVVYDQVKFRLGGRDVYIWVSQKIRDEDRERWIAGYILNRLGLKMAGLDHDRFDVDV